MKRNGNLGPSFSSSCCERLSDQTKASSPSKTYDRHLEWLLGGFITRELWPVGAIWRFLLSSVALSVLSAFTIPQWQRLPVLSDDQSRSLHDHTWYDERVLTTRGGGISPEQACQWALKLASGGCILVRFLPYLKEILFPFPNETRRWYAIVQL